MFQARVRMPRMGSSVHESTVVEWKKSVGDRVLKGDALLSAESDKVEFEIESPAAGVITEILVDTEATVPVGEVLAILETEEEVPDEEAQAPAGPPPTGPPKSDEWVAPVAPLRREKTPASPAPVPAAAQPPGLQAQNKWLSPRVQRLAAQYGIGIGAVAAIPGTGAGGRVTARDVERFVREGGAGGAEAASTIALSFDPIASGDERERREPFSRMRKRIAENLTRSVSEIPQVSTFLEVDMSRVAAWREANKEAFAQKRGAGLTYMPFFALAIIAALREPGNARMNGTCEDSALTVKRYVNLGLAVDSPEGLVVPVLRGADALNVAGLALGRADLAERARGGGLSPDDVGEGTITLTNFGASGALYGNPLILPPQVAIVGTGAVAPRAAALPGGALGIRPTMGLSLTFDHRANDGMAAGRFAASIRAALEGMDLSQLEY